MIWRIFSSNSQKYCWISYRCLFASLSKKIKFESRQNFWVLFILFRRLLSDFFHQSWHSNSSTCDKNLIRSFEIVFTYFNWSKWKEKFVQLFQFKHVCLLQQTIKNGLERGPAKFGRTPARTKTDGQRWTSQVTLMLFNTPNRPHRAVVVEYVPREFKIRSVMSRTTI